MALRLSEACTSRRLPNLNPLTPCPPQPPSRGGSRECARTVTPAYVTWPSRDGCQCQPQTVVGTRTGRTPGHWQAGPAAGTASEVVTTGTVTGSRRRALPESGPPAPAPGGSIRVTVTRTASTHYSCHLGAVTVTMTHTVTMFGAPPPPPPPPQGPGQPGRR